MSQPTGPIDDFWAVIPAGGAGTRLWPLSRSAYPKFLRDLTGSGRSLLQETHDRLSPLTEGRILVVTGRAHREPVLEQLPGLDAESVLAEPSARDSMAAIGLAAALLERSHPDAVMGSFAADHVITEAEEFRACVRTAVEAQPWTTFVGRAGRGEYSAFLIGWGSNPDGSHPLRNILATVNRDRGWGASNRGRYSNPQVDAMLLESLSELDQARRETLIVGAMRIAMEDVAVVPIHIQTNIWATRRGFEYTASVDEGTLAQRLRPAPR